MMMTTHEQTAFYVYSTAVFIILAIVYKVEGNQISSHFEHTRIYLLVYQGFTFQAYNFILLVAAFIVASYLLHSV